MADDKIRPDRPSRRRDDDDDYDDRPRRRRRRRDEDEDDYDDRRRDDGISTLIPYKNPQALTGYYLSVFSLIPCAGLFLGPAAVVLGLLAMKYRKTRPRAGGAAHAIVALVLGGITSLVNWGAVLFMVVSVLMRK